jgi:hypothetical protein
MAPTIELNSARRVTRTVFAAVVGLAAMLPLIYSAAAQHDPGEATGWAALLLAIAGAITRVMAVPAVEAWLQRFFPFLAALPDTERGTARPRRAMTEE